VLTKEKGMLKRTGRKCKKKLGIKKKQKKKKKSEEEGEEEEEEEELGKE
jgi:hypothetical protein